MKFSKLFLLCCIFIKVYSNENVNAMVEKNISILSELAQKTGSTPVQTDAEKLAKYIKDGEEFKSKLPKDKPYIPKNLSTLNYKGFLDDFAKYKTTNRGWHGGDLLEHSIWVAQVLDQWFEEKSPWVAGLSVRDRYLMQIAGVLHDIGKAGVNPDKMKKYIVDREAEKAYRGGHKAFIDQNKEIQKVYFHNIEDHENIGFDYLMNPKNNPYYLTTGEQFNFKNYLKYLKLNDNEQKIVAVLVGFHYSFGMLMKDWDDIEYGEEATERLDGFIQELSDLASKAKTTLTLELLKMGIALNAADVKAFEEAKAPEEKKGLFMEVAKQYKKSGDPDYNRYEGFEFPTKGFDIQKALIKRFKAIYPVVQTIKEGGMDVEEPEVLSAPSKKIKLNEESEVQFFEKQKTERQEELKKLPKNFTVGSRLRRQLI
ncbi:MAG: hypothetical protein UR26_C0003G0134 [candidate division TM6 bacterium GW2011_GWF2_32_72]|nr:MAG: hypothetical protein UR26_C0003G0134 [candidate division TM6 bacterium GW2011_GWF2_32_72]